MRVIVETLTYSDYARNAQVPSEIDPDKSITKHVGLQCPHCKAMLPVIYFNGRQNCKCGLEMRRLGNALECTLIAED